jgi:hypothetical protein
MAQPQPRRGSEVEYLGMLSGSARSSMDRASDYGSEGWGFDSLRARIPLAPIPQASEELDRRHFQLHLALAHLGS